MASKRMPGLREVREAREFTVRRLAKESGVSYPNISRIEHGQAATPETARKLAGVLNVGVEDLYEGFASWEIQDDQTRALYEETHNLVRAAEKRAYDGRPTLFDERLEDRVYELLNVADSLPPGEEKARLREQAQKLARRAGTALLTEAELEAARKKAKAQKLLEVGEKELVGAA